MRAGLALLGSGLLIAFIGVLYGAVFVGVLFQDSTPTQSARQAMHLRISDVILIAGCLLFVVGLVLTLTRVIRRTFKSTPHG